MRACSLLNALSMKRIVRHLHTLPQKFADCSAARSWGWENLGVPNGCIANLVEPGSSGLGDLFPPGVALATIGTCGAPPLVDPSEARAVADAVPQRRLEFALGRACARSAIAALGHQPVPILVRSDRSPQWPLGIVGSISHAPTLCVAAAASAASFRSVGIDAEPDVPLPLGVAHRVCTIQELESAERLDGGLSIETLIFSAKECVYKTWYPVVGRWLGFLDVVVLLDGERSRFQANLVSRSDRRDFPWTLVGRYARSEGLLVTALALEK